jgi:ABC-type sulfate/molybdate transport systems ATPase subunit
VAAVAAVAAGLGGSLAAQTLLNVSYDPTREQPFGALDAKVRQELRRWLRRLHAEIHLTSVFVTHDQEALELANRVVVMNEGKIEQDGTPADVVEHPATPFVVNFLGQVRAIVKVEVLDDERRPIQVELGREQYEQIRAIIGEKVYVKPRKVRVFMETVVRSP